MCRAGLRASFTCITRCLEKLFSDSAFVLNGKIENLVNQHEIAMKEKEVLLSKNQCVFSVYFEELCMKFYLKH